MREAWTIVKQTFQAFFRDGATQLAAKRAFFAGILAHLVARREVGQFPGDLLTVLGQTLLFGGSQLTGDSFRFSLIHFST